MQHYLKPLKKTNPDIYFDDIKKSIQENFNQGLTLWAEKVVLNEPQHWQNYWQKFLF